MGLIDILIVIGIIAVAIAIDRWFARQAKDWVKLIEQIGEDQKVKEEKLRRHLERIEEEQKREKLFEMNPATEKIIEEYLKEHSERGDTSGSAQRGEREEKRIPEKIPCGRTCGTRNSRRD